jgi:hypothetical protein
MKLRNLLRRRHLTRCLAEPLSLSHALAGALSHQARHRRVDEW